MDTGFRRINIENTEIFALGCEQFLAGSGCLSNESVMRLQISKHILPFKELQSVVILHIQIIPDALSVQLSVVFIVWANEYH